MKKEKINLKIKENKGSITLFVLISMVFFAVILAGVYISSINKQKSTLDSVEKIAENYKVEEDELEGTYAKVENKLSMSTDISDLLNRVNELENSVEALQNNNNNNNLESVYPVGSIYISTKETNPATLFGGTWEEFGQGKTLVGYDENDTDFDTAGETGGEKTHTLTESEMPRHYHNGLYWYTGIFDGSKYGISLNTGTNTAYKLSFTGTINSYGGATNLFYTGYSGGDENGNTVSHNNLQPYIVTYMWKRIS